MKILIGFLTSFCLLTFGVHGQQAFLSTPIAGEYGKDYIIVNYVDWSFDSIQDANCGTKTYNSHEGTDFVIAGFEEMATGVNVKAAAGGVVTFVQDGLFDQETGGDVSKLFGNYICIKHPNLYYSYYAHLKSGSIKVQSGDEVVDGQVLAQVGSSGNSTDPHLHFELWYDSLQLVDPFEGDCGNPTTNWMNPINYDTSFAIWKSSLSGLNPSLNEMRFGLLDRTQILLDIDEYTTYWNLQYGLRKGDVTTIKWYNDSTDVFTYELTYDKDYWFYYFNSYIFPTTTGLCDNCKVEYYMNNQLIETKFFQTVVSVDSKEQNLSFNPQSLEQFLNSKTDIKANIYTRSGQGLGSWRSQNNTLTPGIYLVEMINKNSGKRKVGKLVIR